MKFTLIHHFDGRIEIRDGATSLIYWSPSVSAVRHFCHAGSQYGICFSQPDIVIFRCREGESIEEAVSRVRTREVEVVE
jgi:hypothetical protein